MVVPDPDSDAIEDSSKSLAWHFVACGGYYLFDDLASRPAPCTSCGASNLESVSPTLLFSFLPYTEPVPGGPAL